MRALNSAPADEAAPFTHLVPLIDLLVAHGNQPLAMTRANRWGFYRTQGGWMCAMRDPIDFSLIRRSFELPPSIRLNPAADAIYCDRTWIEIKGPIGRSF